jgi:hypothetical protein
MIGNDRKLIALAAGFALTALSAQASTDYSFSGNFTGDADVVRFDFTVGATSSITLRSYSYAGGTMADGTVVAAGGFDPILALWDAAGNKIGEWDDGPDPVPVDPTTGHDWDALLTLSSLAAGSYTATLAEFSNFSLTDLLSDGFERSSANFTGDLFGCSNGQFCDFGGNNRTGFWAFDVLGVETAAVSAPAVVPLPAGLPLLLAGLGALGLKARRRKS